MEQLHNVLSTLLVAVVTAATPILVRALIVWLQKQTLQVENAYARTVLQRLIEISGQKVLALAQTEVKYLKEQAESGKLDKSKLPEILAGVKQKALDSVKMDANAQGLWVTAQGVFNNDQGSLEQWLKDVIESQVFQLPPSGLGKTAREVVAADISTSVSPPPPSSNQEQAGSTSPLVPPATTP